MTILLMTGYADQRERAEELDAIILDVVQKPFTLADIRDACRPGAGLLRLRRRSGRIGGDRRPGVAGAGIAVSADEPCADNQSAPSSVVGGGILGEEQEAPQRRPEMPGIFEGGAAVGGSQPVGLPSSTMPAAATMPQAPIIRKSTQVGQTHGRRGNRCSDDRSGGSRSPRIVL